jgi:UDP-N-acetyl-2-amino-2-deoxyglucuronate dehydrogenase
MRKDTIKAGLIGYGAIGKRHEAILSQHPEFDLKAVCDTDYQQLNSLPSSIARYSNHRLLLEKEELDLVVIASPNGYHYNQGLASIDSGAHVLIEKPVCLKSEEVINLQKQSESKQVKVFTVLQNRYSPPVKWLRDIVHQGILGSLRYIQVNCFWNRDERYYYPNGVRHPWRGTKDLDGGVLYTQFSHFIDLITWIFKEVRITDKEAFKLKDDDLEIDDSGSFTFKCNSTRGRFNYSTSVYSQNLTSEITVLGSKGTVKIAGQYMNRVEVCNIENYTMPQLKETQKPNTYNGFQGSANNHALVYQNVADVLLRNANQDATLDEAYQCIRLIENATQSSKDILGQSVNAKH